MRNIKRLLEILGLIKKPTTSLGERRPCKTLVMYELNDGKSKELQARLADRGISVNLNAGCTWPTVTEVE